MSVIMKMSQNHTVPTTTTIEKSFQLNMNEYISTSQLILLLDEVKLFYSFTTLFIILTHKFSYTLHQALPSIHPWS